jgi:hypothetical protein
MLAGPVLIYYVAAVFADTYLWVWLIILSGSLLLHAKNVAIKQVSSMFSTTTAPAKPANEQNAASTSAKKLTMTSLVIKLILTFWSDPSLILTMLIWQIESISPIRLISFHAGVLWDTMTVRAVIGVLSVVALIPEGLYSTSQFTAMLHDVAARQHMTIPFLLLCIQIVLAAELYPRTIQALTLLSASGWTGVWNRVLSAKIMTFLLSKLMPIYESTESPPPGMKLKEF